MELSKKFLKKLIFILGLVVLTAPVAFGAVTVAQGIQSVAASDEDDNNKVPLEDEGAVSGVEDGSGEGPSTEPSTDPTITLKKTMVNTKGYKPSASDVFTVNFEQLDNLGKYWNDEKQPDVVFAPRTNAPLTATSITGNQATEGIDSDTKTATATYKLASSITTPGYYTYRITEGTVNAISDGNGSRSWTNVGTQAYIMTVFLDDEKNYTVKVKPEDDMSVKGSEVNFTNKLTAKQNVSVKKLLKGTGLLAADKEKSYDIKVTINGLTDDVQSTGGLTFKNGVATTISLQGDKSDTIQNVPVGATVTISEDGLTGFVASVARDSAPDKVTTGAQSQGVTLSNAMVTMGATDNQATENAFTVTNTRDSIVDTGVKVVTNPFVIMLVVALAGVAGYVVLKRKLSKKL